MLRLEPVLVERVPFRREGAPGGGDATGHLRVPVGRKRWSTVADALGTPTRGPRTPTSEEEVAIEPRKHPGVSESTLTSRHCEDLPQGPQEREDGVDSEYSCSYFSTGSASGPVTHTHSYRCQVPPPPPVDLRSSLSLEGEGKGLKDSGVPSRTLGSALRWRDPLSTKVSLTERVEPTGPESRLWSRLKLDWDWGLGLG